MATVEDYRTAVITALFRIINMSGNNELILAACQLLHEMGAL